METSLGKPIQTGEFRKNPVEPAWVCPSGYEYEIIDREPFKMEYLKPEGVVTGRVVLQLHGGGYIGPMKNIYRKFSVRYSRLSYGGDVLTVDYRVAPEHPYPAALEDVIHAYQWLVKEKHYRPGQVVVAGDSAGGGLALALCLYLRDHGMPQPAGLVLMSPWADLTCSGDSYEFNLKMILSLAIHGRVCFTIPHTSAALIPGILICRLYSGISGACRPCFFRRAAIEMLLSDTLEAAQNARRAGVKRRVSVYEGMFHVFQMSMDLVPESREAWDEVARFMQIVYKIDRRPAGQIVKKVKRR